MKICFIVNECSIALNTSGQKITLNSIDAIRDIIEYRLISDDYAPWNINLNTCSKHSSIKYSALKRQCKRFEKARVIINKTQKGQYYNFNFCDRIEEMIKMLKGENNGK